MNNMSKTASGDLSLKKKQEELEVITENMKDMFVTAAYTYESKTIPANGEIVVQATGNDIPSGFSPKAVVAYSSSAAGVPVRALNAQNGQLVFVNTKSTAVEISPSMTVLCIKNYVKGE